MSEQTSYSQTQRLFGWQMSSDRLLYLSLPSMLHFPLCSALYTVLQMKKSMREVPLQSIHHCAVFRQLVQLWGSNHKLLQMDTLRCQQREMKHKGGQGKSIMCALHMIHGNVIWFLVNTVLPYCTV